MKQIPKYNLDHCGTEIKKALQRARRGSISLAECSAIIQTYGRKIGETRTVYEPDEVLDFSRKYDVT